MKKHMYRILFIVFLFLSFAKSFAQNAEIDIQNEKFIKDIDIIIEELQFMYDTDQALREYTLFKTYNKALTDSIESLPSDKVREYIQSKNFKSDSIGKRIREKYILPIDSLNIERIIELTKIYGFPSISRIKKIYKKELDKEFNPYLLVVHAPKKYWEELKLIIKKELKNKNLSRCEYGHMLWHLNGRKNIQDMLDNGYKLVTNEDGQKVLQAVDCE